MTNIIDDLKFELKGINLEIIPIANSINDLLKPFRKNKEYTIQIIDKLAKIFKESKDLLDKYKKTVNDLEANNIKIERCDRKKIFEYIKQGDLLNITLSLLYMYNPDITDKDRWTALHIAVLNNNISIALFFIKIGADLDLKNNNQETSLHIAVTHNHIKLIKRLLPYYPFPFFKNFRNKTPFGIVKSKEMGLLIKQYENKYTEYCIKNKEIIKKYGNLLLLIFTQRKLHDALDKLLIINWASGIIDINYSDNEKNTALHLAIKNDDALAVEILLFFKPDSFLKNKNGKYPLDLTESNLVKIKLKFYEKEKIKTMLEEKEIVEKKGNFLLLYSVRNGYYRSIRQMIPFFKNKIIDIDTYDKEHNSALHFAVIKKEYEILGLLLKNNADMLSINNQELMPVDFIDNDKTMERIFTNFDRMWVLKKIRNNP